MLPDVQGEHILLLQGPNGPFFRRFHRELLQRGARVTKVNFNAGDALFHLGVPALGFRRPMSQWPDYLRNLLIEGRITRIYLFGDHRPHHQQAIQIAKALSIPVYVFEQGYLRPNYVTCELGGVNGNSLMSRDPEFYRQAPRGPTLPRTRWAKRAFLFDALYTTFYAMAYTIFFWRYPHYRHHRNLFFLWQMCIWVYGAFRKVVYRQLQKPILGRATGEWAHRYFLVPLQVHCDFQLDHSAFSSVTEFIEHTISVFAAHAPRNTLLIFKHHPHDRAYTNYRRLLKRLAKKYDLVGRISYVHDLDLPTLIKHARGTITINSTVGLQSAGLGTPVKTLGRAIYDLPGIVYQGPLEDFFVTPGTVNKSFYECFERWLLANNQINGYFQRRLPGVNTPTGMQFLPSARPVKSPVYVEAKPTALVGEPLAHTADP